MLEGLKRRRRLQRSGSEALSRLELLARSQTTMQWRDACLGQNPLLAYGAKHWSQNDEDGLIAEIVRRVHGAQPGSFVELGVGDGTENNTLNLLARGWQGAWLGGEPLRLRTDCTRLQFKQCWIDRDNVSALVRERLSALGVEQPTLLSTDLDGNDWHLCHALLAAGLRPAVWVLEYNAHFDVGTHWVMPYDAAHVWKGDDHFGASLRAFVELFAPAGYRLVCCNLTGANAFFVQSEHAAAFAEVQGPWQSLYMPPRYVSYPRMGHPPSLAVMQSLLGSAPTLDSQLR